MVTREEYLRNCMKNCERSREGFDERMAEIRYDSIMTLTRIECAQAKATRRLRFERYKG